MTLKEALAEARRRLQGVPEAALESELLLRHHLDISLPELYLRLNDKLAPEQERGYLWLIDRRLDGEPSAYITGQREFYGLPFYVNPSVIIPRPETELLVARALELCGRYSTPVIADIGTGSGVIAIMLARHLPQARLYAIDISPQALETARCNARRHGVEGRIEFIQGDLLMPLPEAVDAVAANLPYVRSDELPNAFEPRHALDGGADGLDMLRRLGDELPSKLKDGGSVFLEIGLGQAAAVGDMLKSSLPLAHVDIFPDMAGIERVMVATLPGPDARR